jgi:dehydrogenase/reductase SDR family member 7B
LHLPLAGLYGNEGASRPLLIGGFMKRFEDKVFWITVASSGIGEALALELATGGARLIISARRRELLDALAARCADPSVVHVLPMDVAETDRAAEHVKDAVSRFGRVDVMVHNAGIGQRSLIVTTPIAVDRRIMEVNYFGVVALTRALLPEMMLRGGGQFVVISSLAGYVGTPYRSTYSASKHALHGFFESLRGEHAKDEIDVTMVCPGFVRTEIAKKAAAVSGEDMSKHTAVEAGLRPEEAARKIAHGIARRKREIYVGGAEIVSVYLRRYAPGVLATALKHIKTT